MKGIEIILVVLYHISMIEALANTIFSYSFVFVHIVLQKQKIVLKKVKSLYNTIFIFALTTFVIWC